MNEFPVNPHEQAPTPEALLTAAVDLRLPPISEHRPIQVFEGPMKGIRREVKLVEDNPLDRRYLYLTVSSGLEAGAAEYYSVRAYDSRILESTTYTWSADEPIKVTALGVDREPEENEVEKLIQRIYTAPVFDPRLHTVYFKKRKLRNGTEMVPVLGEQPALGEPPGIGIGRMILKVFNKIRKR